MNFKINRLLFWAVMLLFGCEADTPKLQLFTKLSSENTHVNFVNKAYTAGSAHILNNNNVYAGGGVAVGDVNNDNLQDFIVISNQGAPGLYINEGKMQFKDIAQEAGIVKTLGWNNGVVMEDINADGWLDIYISKGIYDKNSPTHRKNLLYINNKDNTFTESAEEYGIANSNVTIQSVFIDFDLDGDLDLYNLNQPQNLDPDDLTIASLDTLRQNNSSKKNSDTFYLNTGNNKFRNISKKMGIQNWGNGSGIGLGDFNENGYPDIYITNEGNADNFFYLNMNGKKFLELGEESFRHTSLHPKGCDLADINNDGLIDIFEVGNMPNARKREVVNISAQDTTLNRNKNFSPQFNGNSLQLNRAMGNFSEIAQVANISKTDWSWGTLLVDANDDGYKDIIITNGIKYDIKNQDYLTKVKELSKDSNKPLTFIQHESILTSTQSPNYAFENKKNTVFEDVSNEWGFDDTGFSSGLAYGDLDNDGDLDLIVNNLDESPWIYQNNSRENGNNSINFKLGPFKENTNGLGSKITIYHNGEKQYAEHFTVRGFQSSSQHIIHFGLGDKEQIDSLKVVWPGGKTQIISTPMMANKTYTLEYKNATLELQKRQRPDRLFTAASNTYGLYGMHQELEFDDFKHEPSLPHKLSQLGPALATGDVNNDGVDDIYIGAATSFAAKLFLSNNDKYTELNTLLWENEKDYEDISATFFDADGDGDKDLYVVSGSNEFEEGSKLYQDRLYLNNGSGQFVKSNDALPVMITSGGCVDAADFDNDGDQDLFIGTRLTPGKYPNSSSSYLLVNDGGKFTDKTAEINSELTTLGMVTSAKWSDYDKDGDKDLFVVSEWSGIKVFNNKNGKLSNVSSALGLDDTEGWWFHINEIDFDKDGDMDYVCGNIGDNHKFKASVDKPFQLFGDDFDSNGSQDIVLAFYEDDSLYPLLGLENSSNQIPFIKDKFQTYSSFADANMKDIFGDKLSTASSLKATTFSSYILENKNGKFQKIKLPPMAQYSAITSSIEADVNKDGHPDLMVAGNMPHTGVGNRNLDASFGVCMLGNGKGKYEAVPLYESGFFAAGDVKNLRMVDYRGKKIIIMGNNGSRLQSYLIIK